MARKASRAAFKDPVWRGLCRALSAEMRGRADEEPPRVPTFEDAVAKAGGRTVQVPVAVGGPEDWHDLEA